MVSSDVEKYRALLQSTEAIIETQETNDMLAQISNIYMVISTTQDENTTNLGEWLRRRGGSRNVRAVQSIMYQLLLGLRHVHSVNVIHRDIKPQNILYSEKAI